MRNLALIPLIIFSINAFAIDFTSCRKWSADNGNLLGYASKIQNISNSMASNLQSIQNDKGIDAEISKDVLKHSTLTGISITNQLHYITIVMQQSFTAKLPLEYQTFANDKISHTFYQIKRQLDYLNNTIPLIQNSANTRELIRFRDQLEDLKINSHHCN